MNALGFFIWGSVTAGFAYCAGMLIIVFAVALAVWAQGKRHAEWRLGQPATPLDIPNLPRILRMVLIVVMAFIAVGLLRVGG
jgi:hypothetical protein